MSMADRMKDVCQSCGHERLDHHDFFGDSAPRCFARHCECGGFKPSEGSLASITVVIFTILMGLASIGVAIWLACQ